MLRERECCCIGRTISSYERFSCEFGSVWNLDHLALDAFLAVRDGLTGPEEALFAGTPRQTVKNWLLSGPLLLCSHVSRLISHNAEALAALVKY
jgi:hypothetical protein